MDDVISAPVSGDDHHFVMIPLTRGKFALVDERDAEMILSRGSWCAVPSCTGRTFYAVRTDYAQGNRRKIAMHALIAGHKGPDHVNRNGLDNRRVNLRAATVSQNFANETLQVNNTSGFKGVSWSRRHGGWRAKITIAGRGIHLGYFDDPVEGARAYNRAALEAWGEYAWLNPVPSAPPVPEVSPGERGPATATAQPEAAAIAPTWVGVTLRFPRRPAA